jgi:hypothetical protein
MIFFIVKDGDDLMGILRRSEVKQDVLLKGI